MRAVLLVLLACLSVSSAQQDLPETRIALVNSRAVLNAHPNGTSIAALREEASAALKAVRDEAVPLEGKAREGTLTPDERARLSDLANRYNALAQSYQQRLNELIAPITKDVDAAVSQTAQEQGFALVMESNTAGAGGTNVLVYVDVARVDITKSVIAKLKAR